MVKITVSLMEGLIVAGVKIWPSRPTWMLWRVWVRVREGMRMKVGREMESRGESGM